jgi:pyridoxine/pyridoxamine 5'-phosphate oxidase
MLEDSESVNLDFTWYEEKKRLNGELEVTLTKELGNYFKSRSTHLAP